MFVPSLSEITDGLANSRRRDGASMSRYGSSSRRVPSAALWRSWGPLLGITVFLGVHSLTTFRETRTGLIERFGLGAFKRIYSWWP
jgi:hypothetical protein